MNVIEARRSKADQQRREIIAKRLATERRDFFARVVIADTALRGLLDLFAKNVTQAVMDKADDPSKIRRINEILHDEAVLLRSQMRVWLNSAIRDSAKMGFRQIGDALLPIFKHNRESMQQEVVAEQALFEGRLVFGMKQDFAKRAKPQIAVGTTTYTDAVATVLSGITKKNLAGLNPSDRIWDLTTRTEMDLKRIVANGIGQGDNPAVIARRIKKYVSTERIDAAKMGQEIGTGSYRSPYRNALRLARTEMNRTYNTAAASFAKNKPWVDGMDINLSSQHDEPDECDDLAAGGPYTPDEVQDLIPAHPHCMCFATPRIDPKYLGEEE